MASLLVWAAAFLVLHLGISGTPLRRPLAGRLGERGFRGAFSGVAVVLLLQLCRAYAAAPTHWLWHAPDGVRFVLAVLMLPAFVLVVLSLWPEPAALRGPDAPAHGIHRVTRHPMMVGISLWALVHLVGRGELGALVFFGTFLVNAGIGMRLIDHKLHLRDPGHWAELMATTSILPFAAVLGRRNDLRRGEIAWPGVLLGTALWAAFLATHGLLFGVRPL